MTKMESDCVECGLPCLGRTCPHYKVQNHYCDKCKADEYAYYEIDGDEYCESHARDYVQEILEDMDLGSILDFLEINWKRII